MTRERRKRFGPLALAGGLVAGGAMLLKMRPGALELPEPALLGDDNHEASGARRLARRSRDGVAHFVPSNLSDSLGRSLVIAGLALAVTRLLDEAAGGGKR